MIRTSEPVLLRDETRFAGEDAFITLGVELVAGCAGVDLALTRDAANITRVGDAGAVLSHSLDTKAEGVDTSTTALNVPLGIETFETASVSGTSGEASTTLRSSGFTLSDPLVVGVDRGSGRALLVFLDTPVVAVLVTFLALVSATSLVESRLGVLGKVTDVGSDGDRLNDGIDQLVIPYHVVNVV